MLRFALAAAAGLACTAAAQAAPVARTDSVGLSLPIQHVQYTEEYRRDYRGEDRDYRGDDWRRRHWLEERARRDAWRRDNYRRYHRDYDEDE